MMFIEGILLNADVRQDLLKDGVDLPQHPFRPVRPRKAGVYSIWRHDWSLSSGETHTPLYVGQSVCLYTRLTQHFGEQPTGLFAKMWRAWEDEGDDSAWPDLAATYAWCVFVECPNARTSLERAEIARLAPRWNVH